MAREAAKAAKPYKMKSYNNVFFEIVSFRNLYYAAMAQLQRNGKSKQAIRWKENFPQRLVILYNVLNNGNYITPAYRTFQITEPKPRDIKCLPFTCRIVHEAMLIQIRPIIRTTYTRDTYACLPGRGQHGLLRQLKKDIRLDPEGTKYCWQGDVKHYYQSIIRELIYQKLCRYIRCWRTRSMLRELIYSILEGLPLGNQPSQDFAILYLTELDHIIKEVWGAKYYYRYNDNFVLLSDNKRDLHRLSWMIRNYCYYELGLTLNNHRQLYEVEHRGIDIVGYRVFHGKILMRKSIKKELCRRVVALRRKRKTNDEIKISVSSHLGWARHATVNALLIKLGLMEEKKQIINADDYSDFTETKITADVFNEEPVTLLAIRKKKSKYQERGVDYYYHVKVEHNGKTSVVACYNEGDINLLEAIQEHNAFPIDMRFKRIEHKQNVKKYLIKNV